VLLRLIGKHDRIRTAPLKAINKKITVEQIERSAALLRRYGIKARFYMMLGQSRRDRGNLSRDTRFPRPSQSPTNTSSPA
ncbi:MAG: hypothetical protein QM784_03120, partial [Polyangiaceae bacterium]